MPVTVLGFGDRQFPAFCAFAKALDQTLRAQGWPALLPLECIHQQSGQQFARWGVDLAQALGQPLVLEHVPRLPPTTELTLLSRQDYPNASEAGTAILRFSWPGQGLGARLRGHGLGRFAAGDLVGIVPPGSSVPRYYSLASGQEDGFLEICVRQMPGGLCSTHLLGLQQGERIRAFIRPNPGFALPRARRPVLLIGAGTGVAPLSAGEPTPSPGIRSPSPRARCVRRSGGRRCLRRDGDPPRLIPCPDRDEIRPRAIAVRRHRSYLLSVHRPHAKAPFCRSLAPS